MRGWLRENVKLGDNMKTQVEEHEGPRCNSRIACVRTIIERDKTRELRRISKRQEGIKETVQITKGCDYIPMQLVLLVLIIRKDRRNNSRICFYVHTYILFVARRSSCLWIPTKAASNRQGFWSTGTRSFQ